MLNAFLLQKGKPLKTEVTRAEMLQALSDKSAVLWVDMEAPSEFESDVLVEIFNFHPLAVEDCLCDHSEPKVDDYDEYLFLVMHAIGMENNPEKGTEELKTKELEIFIGKNYVVTFHKAPVWSVNQVRELVKRKPEAYLGNGTDKLLHAVLDYLVDHYQPVLDQYDVKIDKLEVEIFNNPPANFLSILMQVKQDIFHLRRIILPQRDTVSYLIRNPDPFMQEHNLMYFRDVYDHLFRIYAMAESFHENLASILQAYFSYSSHKLNEIVKHMTVMATLTMPLLLVSGIYGMNFQKMPELGWDMGYPFAVCLGLGISAAMILWMKWKKWI